MEFKKRKAWRQNRSVLKKGTTPGGQIIYKGETDVYEEDENGNRVNTKTDRFLIRVGKAASRQVTGTTADAKAELIKLLGSVGNTSHLSGGRTKLAAYLRDLFLPSCRGRNLAANTLRHYEYDIENYIIPVLGKVRLEDLTVQHFRTLVRDLRQTKGLDVKTVKNAFGCLRTALNEAIAEGLIESHEARSEKIKLGTLLKRSKAEKKKRNIRQRLKAWAHKELLHFFRVAPADNELTRLALVGCKTGMRPGELCARTWEDLKKNILEIWTAVSETDEKRREVDPELPKWQVADIKTGEGRTIVVDDEVQQALAEQRAYVQSLLAEGKISAEAAEYIFPAHGGDLPYTNPSTLYNRWKFFVTGNKNKRKKKRDPRDGGRPRREPLEGVRFISPYGFRHTHATELLRDRVPTKLVAERLGTSVEMIHQHYGHVLRETEAEVIGDLPEYRRRADK